MEVNTDLHVMVTLNNCASNFEICFYQIMLQKSSMYFVFNFSYKTYLIKYMTNVFLVVGYI